MQVKPTYAKGSISNSRPTERTMKGSNPANDATREGFSSNVQPPTVMRPIATVMAQ